MLGKSVFPLSTGLWWYPTTYAVFLLIQPFYHKGLNALNEKEIHNLVLTMICIWSVSTLIPFFDYGPSNFLCFIMLYGIVFLMKKYGIEKLSKRNCRLIVIIGYLIAGISIMVIDMIGTKMPQVNNYVCYFIRGNFRFLPMIISIGIFRLSAEWRIKNRIINYIASLMFGVYLLHMYPLMMDYLFTNENAIFAISKSNDSTIVLNTVIGVFAVFLGCIFIEIIRERIDKGIIKGWAKIRGNKK